MNKKWDEKTTLEKTMDIIAGIAFCVWMLLEFFGKKIGFAYTETCTSIAICVICACEAVSYWNLKRALSYVAIAGIVLIVAVMILLTF